MNNATVSITHNPFAALTPDLILETVEEAFGLNLDGTLFAYPSYINRVYGLREETGRELVVKFYRPSRWTREQIEAEHSFLAELYRGECPVALPLADAEGETLQTLTVEVLTSPSLPATQDIDFHFCLFPKISGRPFDPETDQDWIRLGALAGRIHVSGRKHPAPSRPILSPNLINCYGQELLDQGLIPDEFIKDFQNIIKSGENILKSAIAGSARTGILRLHGDFHRGNIIDTPDRGLVIIDFDDMVNGPAVQDLWLLLPDHYRSCTREFSLILEGYREFSTIDDGERALIEGLRLLRMFHFLHWQSRQRFDTSFERHFPGWGSRAFWVKTIEDLEDQLSEMGG
ncbi:MAG: serine/threonine protein kinase [Termitinemataceae bacterium]